MKRFIVVAAAILCMNLGAGFLSAQEPVPPRNLETNEGIVPPPGFAFLEGDMLVPASVLSARSAYDAVRWTNGVVYYKFASYISTANRNLMRAAMNELESVAGVYFVPRSGQANYIQIIEDGGNYSYVGMVGGKQQLSIYNWSYKYIIIHELIHALGFQHEQSRTDRDTYVTINSANIEAGMAYNFDIEASSHTVGAYDFCSVMHYDAYAFSKNGQKTILPKPGYEVAGSCMGNRSYLTNLDKNGLALRYPLPGAPADTPQTALSITGGVYTHSVASSGFTVTPNEPGFSCSYNGAPVTNTIWYKITPDKERLLDIYASGYDTVVAVYSGTAGRLFQEACADAYGSSNAEFLEVPLKAGMSYYVGVGGYNGSSGTLSLTVNSYRNVVRNGSFDWTSSVWKRASVPSSRADDKLKCGHSGVFVSLCALAFKGGSGEATSFTQTIKPATLPGGWNFTAGDSLWLGYWVKNTSIKGKVTLTAAITFANGTKQKFAAPTVTGLTGGYYQAFNVGTMLERSDVTKVVIKVINNSTGGKLWVDNVYLVANAGIGLRDGLRNTPREKPETFTLPVGQRRRSGNGNAPFAAVQPLPAPPALN